MLRRCLQAYLSGKTVRAPPDPRTLLHPSFLPEETVDFLGVVQSVTSSVEDGVEGAGVGRPGK